MVNMYQPLISRAVVYSHLIQKIKKKPWKVKLLEHNYYTIVVKEYHEGRVKCSYLHIQKNVAARNHALLLSKDKDI